MKEELGHESNKTIDLGLQIRQDKEKLSRLERELSYIESILQNEKRENEINKNTISQNEIN